MEVVGHSLGLHEILLYPIIGDENTFQTGHFSEIGKFVYIKEKFLG